MVHLSPEELSRGVVACSAGNHAQGVAMSAAHLGCRAVIVMPGGLVGVWCARAGEREGWHSDYLAAGTPAREWFRVFAFARGGSLEPYRCRVLPPPQVPR